MGCSPPPDHSVAPALQAASLETTGRVTRTKRGGTPVERGRQLLGGKEEREEEGRSVGASGIEPASPQTSAVGSRETGERCGGETGDRRLGERGCSKELVAAALQG